MEEVAEYRRIEKRESRNNKVGDDDGKKQREDERKKGDYWRMD